MVGLALRKESEEESWLDAALRSARKYGLEAEVREAYEAHRRQGDDEGAAAWKACYDWDVLLLADCPEEDDT